MCLWVPARVYSLELAQAYWWEEDRSYWLGLARVYSSQPARMYWWEREQACLWQPVREYLLRPAQPYPSALAELVQGLNYCRSIPPPTSNNRQP